MSNISFFSLFFFSFILSNFVTVIPNDKFPTSERGGQDEKREITVKVLTRKLDDRFINVADHFLSLVDFSPARKLYLCNGTCSPPLVSLRPRGLIGRQLTS